MSFIYIYTLGRQAANALEIWAYAETCLSKCDNTNILWIGWLFYSENCNGDTPEPNPECPDSIKATIATHEYCGFITDPNGPFGECIAILNGTSIDTQELYNDCERAVCDNWEDEIERRKQVCEALELFHDICNQYPISIIVWREAGFCPCKYWAFRFFLLISQPKHILWALKKPSKLDSLWAPTQKPVSMRWFFWEPEIYDKMKR